MPAHFIFRCVLPNCPPKSLQQFILPSPVMKQTTFKGKVHIAHKPLNTSQDQLEGSLFALPLDSLKFIKVKLHLTWESREPSARVVHTLTEHAPLPTQPNISWPNFFLRWRVEELHLDFKLLILTLESSGLVCLVYILG